MPNENHVVGCGTAEYENFKSKYYANSLTTRLVRSRYGPAIKKIFVTTTNKISSGEQVVETAMRRTEFLTSRILTRTKRVYVIKTNIKINISRSTWLNGHLTVTVLPRRVITQSSLQVSTASGTVFDQNEPSPFGPVFHYGHSVIISVFGQNTISGPMINNDDRFLSIWWSDEEKMKTKYINKNKYVINVLN